MEAREADYTGEKRRNTFKKYYITPQRKEQKGESKKDGNLIESRIYK